MSGAGFTLQAVVLQSRLDSTGAMIDWPHPNSKGQVTAQRFCAVCKTRLYSTNESRPGIAIVRAGTLDDSAMIVPAAHMWFKHKQRWFDLTTEAEVYDEDIPPDRMMIIFAPNLVGIGG